MNLGSALRERLGEPTRAMMPGGASFAHVFGTVLVFLLGLQIVTGVGLAAFYAPSSTDAWASVAYIQDQASLGWLVRGLHHHGGSAMVVVAGIHLLQTAVAGAYKKPRELVWWTGIVLLALVLAWSLTGYWLRWDQEAFWAAKVEIGIAAGSPVIGGAIKAAVIGGNDTGNLTLTRAYMLHIALIPALVVLLVVGHIALARRHGTLPMTERKRPPVPRWPDQAVRDAIASAIVFVILLAYVVQAGGVALGAPADPGAAFDARPLWTFRWLFEIRELAGSAEQLAAMAAPAIAGGFLAALPLLDRGPERRPKKRVLWLGAVAGLFALIGALTVSSFARDANDEGLGKRTLTAEKQANRARRLAQTYGVPVTGPLDVYATAPMSRARTLYAQRCFGCHDVDGENRKGPLIAPGHGNRAWLTAFLHAPSADEFWGRTKLAQTEEAMKPVELPPADVADLVEWMYAQSGAADVDAAKVARGEKVFDGACTDCHTREDGVSASGPALAGLGSRAYFRSFIANPKSGLHMGNDHSQMPRFDKELALADLDLIAEYLVWLRTATAADVSRLGAP